MFRRLKNVAAEALPRPMALGRRILPVLMTVLVLVGLEPPASAQGSVNRNAIDNALSSTVYLEVQRVYRGYDYSNAGSGFFVHPDGYIFTNWHVVADQVEANWKGAVRELSLTVVSITVVTNPGSAKEKKLPAKVIATDRKRDLAVLKVAAKTSNWIDPSSPASVEIMDEVIVVGFPFGDLLTFNESGGVSLEGTPEPSINIGRVTSLRRDRNDRVVAVQTDAAINPGNSGGPMIDTSGRLAGVVYAEIVGGNQIGFAISPNRVRSFYKDQAVKVAFMPPYAPFPPAAVKLTVEPGILPMTATRGEVSIDRQGIEPLKANLEKTPFGWQAEFTLQTLSPEAAKQDSFLATVHLFGADGRSVFLRAYRLQVVESSKTGIANERDSAALMGDRKLANKMSLHDYARKHTSERAASGETGSGLETDEGQTDEEELPVLGFTGPPGEAVPELHHDLVRYAKQMYKEGRYQEVVEVLERVTQVDPANGVAWEYLEMARARVALQEAQPEPPRQDPEPAVLEDDPVSVDTSGPAATVDLRFMSKAEEGSIRFWIDDEELEPVVFTFKKKQVKSGSGAVEHTFKIDPGRHTLEVALETQKGKSVFSKSFQEAFRPETRWTLRINQYEKDSEPEFFLVQRREN